jgi:hypothetical protein
MKLILFSFLVCSSALAATDPLPSWNDGANKAAIIEFVNAVSTDKDSKFVAPENRIATFDNDGTLWSEVPTVEVEFTKMRLQEVLQKNPALRSREPYASLLKDPKAALPNLTQKQILDIMATTHADLTEDEFAEKTKEFFSKAVHPKLRVPYTQTAYKPMLELLDLLRAKGFQVFISSGGDTSFMRVITESMYGITPENVIGSNFKNEAIERNGKLVIHRTAKFESINDKAEKPVGIYRRIGKRPILSVGNERNGGDVEHLRFTSEGSGPSLSILINHDDADREAAYNEKDSASLTAAKKYKWQVISMKKDWKQVFNTEARRVGAR